MTPSVPPPGRRATAWLTLLVLTATAAHLGWHSLSDRDVWLHARAGRDILASGRVPDVNGFAFTAPDHPWVNHEWLFQVLIAATAPPPGIIPPGDAQVVRWNLLRTFLAAVLVLTLLLADGGRALLRGKHPPGRILLAGAASLAGLGLLWPRLTMRPELLSYILFVLVLRQIEVSLSAAPAGRLPWALLDPRQAAGRATLLTVVWTQLHGFAAAAGALWLLVGLAVILAPPVRTVAVPDGLAPRRRVGLALAGAAIAFVALAATPNGLAGLLYPLRALAQFGPDRPRLGEIISELVPTLRTTGSLGTTLLLFQASLAWSVLWIATQWGRVPLSRVLVLVAAAIVAWTGQRGLGPYGVAFVLLHTGTEGGLRWPGPAGVRTVPSRARVALQAVALLAVVALAGTWCREIRNDRFYLGEGVARRWGSGLTPAHAAVESGAALDGLGATRVLANVDAAGVLLALSDAHLFIDGRTEAYPPDLWLAYADLRRGGPAAHRHLERWRPNAVCLTLGGAFATLVGELDDAPEWQLVHAGAAAVVFRPAAAGLAAAAPGERARRLLQAAAAPALSPARAGDLCLAAFRLQDLAGDSDAAAAALAAGVRRRPDHPVLRHNLGNALLARGDAAGARAHFLAALAVNGRLAASALNAGVCAARLGESDAAIADFRRAVDIDPRLFAGWANLGSLLSAAGRPEEGLKALERAAALRPDDATLQTRIRELRRSPTR